MRETAFGEEWFRVGTDLGMTWPFILHSKKVEKYGEYIAMIERKFDGAILNDDSSPSSETKFDTPRTKQGPIGLACAY